MINMSSDEDQDYSISKRNRSSASSARPSLYATYKNTNNPMERVDEPEQPEQPEHSEAVEPNPAFEEILSGLTKQSMFSCFQDTFASSRVPPLIDPQSIMHSSRLYSFQINALRRIQKAILGTLTPEEFKETATTSEERNVIVNDTKRSFGKLTASNSTGMEPIDVAQICQTVVWKPQNFRVRMPCGSGKTAVCIWAALLFSRNTLIVTDSYENAVQSLKYILKYTNIARLFDVKFVCTDDGELNKDLSGLLKARSITAKVTRIEDDINTDEGNQTRRHILDDGGTFGIAIISCNLFKDRERSANTSTILRRTVFQSTFDLLVVDEADTTMANGVRHALEMGVLADSGTYDVVLQSSLKRRYILRYKFGLFLSATWCRGVSDPRGAEYLLNIPQIVSMTAKEISDMGLIAKSYINIVVCKDTDPWIVDASKKKEKKFTSLLKDLMPSHMRAIESIVNMHAYYGHKIMIFTHYFPQFRMLERLFPNALTVSGEQNSRNDRSKILEQMKTKTAYGEPFILLATNVCATGLDIPDLNVVINAVNFGESDRNLTQRFGRGSRLYDGKNKCYLYDVIAIGQHDWVKKIIDPLDPFQWSNVPRYSLLVADGYKESIRLWTDTELIENMQQCVLATAENKETATIHKAPLYYDRDDFKKIHVIGFLRDQRNDKNVFPDCKSSEALQPTPTKRKTQSTNSGRFSKALKNAKDRKGQFYVGPPACASVSSGKAKMPAIANGSSSGAACVPYNRATVPEYFSTANFHLMVAQILGIGETTTNAQFIWTQMLAMEASVIEEAKKRELERSKTRATLVLHNNIQGLCPFPLPPAREA